MAECGNPRQKNWQATFSVRTESFCAFLSADEKVLRSDFHTLGQELFGVATLSHGEEDQLNEDNAGLPLHCTCGSDFLKIQATVLLQCFSGKKINHHGKSKLRGMKKPKVN